MGKLIFKLVIIVAAMSSASIAYADGTSSVWSTGVSQPNDGAFGTLGSVSSNAIDATITTHNTTAIVRLAASNGSFLQTDGTSNVSNDELASFHENDAPITNVSFTSHIPLYNFDMLVHNVWNQGGTNQAGAQRLNYIGNFEVYYENGTIISNVFPTVRSIDDDSPFSTDALGGTLQPSGIGSLFDGGNMLQSTSPAFSPGNGAPLGRYYYDPSESVASESQGFGVFSFDESNGGITRVDFTWVGHTEGINTAFVGFAGTTSLAAVPEPSSIIVVLCGSVSLLFRRRRRP